MKTMLYNLKRLLGKKDNRGFTLVEVVIAMALLGLLVSGVITFITPILNMVQNNKQNARATMLSEAINTYIMGNIRSAYRLEVFAGENLADAMANGFQYADSGDKGNITIFMEGHPEYELRCLAMVWKEDNSSAGGGRKKLMLMNCDVSNNFSSGEGKQLKILAAEPVFDDSLYSQLYPTLELHPIVSDAGTIANGYEVTSKVYLSPSCYNILSEDARSSNGANCVSTIYVQCDNFRAARSATVYTPSEATYPSFAGGAAPEELQQKAIDMWNDGTESYEIGSTTYFYTDTFIFYAVSKE